MGIIWFSPSTNGFYHEGVNASVPEDAQEVAREHFTALFEAQALGKLIQPGEGGAPVAVDPPAPDAAQLLAALRRRRNDLLAASDWTQMQDAPLSEAGRAEWAAYRQALRDLPETITDPAAVEWPVPPA